MGLNSVLCNITSNILTFGHILSILEFLLLIFLLFLLFKTLKEKAGFFLKVLFIVFYFFLFGFLSFGLLVVTLLTFGHDDNPPSASYHPLNGAVKLACVYGTAQTCPKTAQDVFAIADSWAKEALKNAKITYIYHPETNGYTLIIRNNDWHANNERVVIFDPRLIQAKQYGRKGLDFFDANIINNCDGTFKITNPPPFPGPWDKIN